MKPFASKQRLCIGGWVLAALALIGLNGFGYLALESKPLQGSSVALRSLRQNLARLDGVWTNDLLNALDRESVDALLVSVVAPLGTEGPVSEGASPQASAEKMVLPKLTGILQMADPNGSLSYMAVLDGRVCRPNDQIMAFWVGRITKDGVLLYRDGKKWFIESPAPYYSSDQGG